MEHTKVIKRNSQPLGLGIPCWDIVDKKTGEVLDTVVKESALERCVADQEEILNKYSIERLKRACKQALEVMEEEKAQWEGTCDLFDDAIEMCEEAIK